MKAAMRGRLVLAAAVAVTTVALVASAIGGTKRGERGPTSVAKLRDADGSAVGRAVLRQRQRGTTRVRVRARGLTPGFHGFHIHETGVCEAPSESADGETGSFLSAGGHFARGSQGHGEHAGDMPPLFADRHGRARASFTIDSYRVGQLSAGDGSVVMIHADPDNLANIPDRYRSGDKPGPDADTLATGDSGDRVACGVVAPKRR